MSGIITYGSYYGTTRCYAEKLGDMLGFPVKDYREIKSLDGFETVIHFGGLYAEKVIGLKEIVRILPDDGAIIICTVGIANPKVKKSVDFIRKGIAKQIPTDVFERAECFHFRGGIDYSRLSFKHKMMMGMMCKFLKKKPENEKTEDDRLLIKTYNQKLDLVNIEDLNPLFEKIICR